MHGWAMCVKANEAFTLFSEYGFNQGVSDIYVIADTGDVWILHDEGDGYYGCTGSNGKHVSFLVECLGE